ncbi:MAG TPA: hypothetical protein VIM70_21370 [Clostridium sp.]|uniref:hypothetical protein n=1 Tax=Clostridium sp. TaxID=1506 RepID=UPI002F92BB66
MKNTKKLLAILLSSVIVLSVAGCSKAATGTKTPTATKAPAGNMAAKGTKTPAENMDVVNGLKAFNAIVKAYPANKGFHKEMKHWGFKLPSGEKFEWTSDTSANKADLAMVMLADPLVKAGLDVTKLDKNEWLYAPAEKLDGMDLPNRIIKTANISDKKEVTNGSEEALQKLINQSPMILTENKEEKHFMLMVGDGNSVHWAQTLGKTDEDMEFVLKAEPLIKAGLDVKKLAGTGFKLEVAGKDNMETKYDQLVKGFKLK